MITEEQRKNRINKIGGSDAAAACGVSTFKTRLRLYQEKKGLVSVQETIAMRRGHALESLLVEIYQELNKESVCTSLNTFTHSKYPWMIGNVDGVCSDGYILECKTTRMFDDRWGPTGSDYIPDDYAMQCQHYCTVTGAKGANLIVMDGFDNIRLYKYHTNTIKEKHMIELEEIFYNMLLNNIEPPPETIDDFFNHSKMLNPDEYIIVDDDISTNLKAFESFRTQKSELEKKIDEHKLSILRKMDKASVVLDYSGKKLIDVSKNRFNVNYNNLKNL